MYNRPTFREGKVTAELWETYESLEDMEFVIERLPDREDAESPNCMARYTYDWSQIEGIEGVFQDNGLELSDNSKIWEVVDDVGEPKFLSIKDITDILVGGEVVEQESGIVEGITEEVANEGGGTR